MNNISVRKSFYPSYCYYLLKQTGLLPTNKEQTLLNEGRKLSEIGSEFSFNGPVAGGPIFTFIYQIPSYLDIDKTEIHDVFEALISFIESKKLSFFMNKWPQKTHYWDLWYTKPWKEYLLNDVTDNSKKALKVIEYFFKLVDKNWDLYKPIYNEKISEYDFI